MTMKDPVRLLDGAGSAAEQGVLRAGAAEQPSEAARQRLAIALGLSSAGPIEAPSGGEPARTGSPGAADALGAMQATATFSAKWLAVTLGTIGIGAAVLATQLLRAPDGQARRASALEYESPARPEPAPSAPAAALAPPAQAPIDEITPPSAAGPASPRRGRQASLAREIAQLDAVRALLADGDPSAALARLRDYAREHTAGVLAQEAATLRIEALLAHEPHTRAHARARTEAARFLRDNPQSPHANRIQALLDDAR